MTQNPFILKGLLGPPFYTPPDGTIVYLVDGTPVDLTGTKLTVSPNKQGSSASITLSDATVPALPAGQLLIIGLENVAPSDIGGVLVLANSGVPTNNGFFIILSRGTGYATESESVIISNPFGAAPDFNNGTIDWFVLQPTTDFLPLGSQGQPLREIAQQNIPLNVVVDQPGPMTFADYDPIQPPLVMNDAGGLFSRVQKA